MPAFANHPALDGRLGMATYECLVCGKRYVETVALPPRLRRPCVCPQHPEPPARLVTDEREG